MKVGDIIIALKKAEGQYAITSGEYFEGKIVKKRSFGESEKVREKVENIEVEVIKAKHEWHIGGLHWVNEKYFELKRCIINEAEDF